MGNGGAETFGLRAQRIALRASTTGHTVQMPVKTYHSTYHTDILPSVGETDELITWVDEELRAAGILDDSGWRDTKLSEDASEDATYKGLEPIAKKIVNLRTTWNKKKKKTKLPQPTTRLVCRPRLETKSEVRGGSMKTDARFILMKSRDGDDKVDDKKVKTCDVGGPMEAKLHLEDRGTNEDQIVGAVSHILYNDPSRRFVLAFTVEGNMMRFWYFSRSHITVSAEFDYHKNPRDFIRFIIFMTFSPLEKLGYDPTVVRVRDDNKDVQYQFTVGDKKYQTVRCIDETSALDIVTRATRVWAVRELDTKDQPIGKIKVLKDVWLYIDAKSEQTIQKEIFAALEELDKTGVPREERPPTSVTDATMADDAKQYFMTIVEDIAVQINGDDDTTLALPTDAVEFCYAPLPAQAPAKHPTVDGGRGLTNDNASGTDVKKAFGRPQLTAPPKTPPVYRHVQRTHRRIVFEEECKTLDTVYNYADFALGLAQLVHGLQYMRLAGFVHRDISPGNCLMYERQIKISDLEYARRYESQGKGLAPLTGTPGFMAIEYQRSRHLFLGKAEDRDVLQDLEADYDLTMSDAPDSWFQYNFLHDLEAVVWLYTWHLIDTLPDCLRADDITKLRKGIKRLRDELFDGSLTGSPGRIDFITDLARDVKSSYEAATDMLKEFYGQADATSFTKGLKAFEHMSQCYYKIERTAPVVPEGEGSTHWAPACFAHSFYSRLHGVFMFVHRKMDGVDYKAISYDDFDKREAKKAVPSLPPPPAEPVAGTSAQQPSSDQLAPNADPGPSRPQKRPAGATVDQEPSKKAKAGTRAGTSRPGKRSAEADVEPETTKKAKRAPAPPDEPPRRSSRLKTAASSGAAKGRKAPAGKTKQAAEPPAASSSRQLSGPGSSAAAGTSSQPAAGPSRRPRTAGVVEPRKQGLRSAKKDKS